MNERLSLVCLFFAASAFAQDFDIEVTVLDDYEVASRLANAGKHQEALAVFEECVAEGNVRCYFGLGTYYYFGDGGIEQDYDKAFELIRSGAEGDYGPAEYLMARMLFDGQGAEADPDTALTYLERAAYKCIAYAQEELAQQYLSAGSDDGIRDAAVWLQLASANGSDNAAMAYNELFAAAPELFNEEVAMRKRAIEADIACQEF